MGGRGVLKGGGFPERGKNRAKFSGTGWVAVSGTGRWVCGRKGERVMISGVFGFEVLRTGMAVERKGCIVLRSRLLRM